MRDLVHSLGGPVTSVSLAATRRCQPWREPACGSCPASSARGGNWRGAIGWSSRKPSVADLLALSETLSAALGGSLAVAVPIGVGLLAALAHGPTRRRWFAAYYAVDAEVSS